MKNLPNIDPIIALITRHTGVSRELLLSPHRGWREVADARFLLVAAIRLSHPRVTLGQMGRLLGRHHSAIGHALRRAMDLAKSDSNFASLRAAVLNLPNRCPTCGQLTELTTDH